MSPVFIFIAVILALGIWGYVQQGDVAMLINQLSAAQIASFASGAGFTGDDLTTAVAIAIAESGGDPNAVGDGGTSIGLWQIHYTVHPEFDETKLTDPAYNAGAAFSIYSARNRNFGAWSTYTVPDSAGVLPYTKYLGAAQQAVTG